MIVRHILCFKKYIIYKIEKHGIEHILTKTMHIVYAYIIYIGIVWQMTPNYLI